MAMTDKEKAFIEEIVSISRKHGLCLVHEDGQGSFIIEEYSESNITWLRAANYNRFEEDK